MEDPFFAKIYSGFFLKKETGQPKQLLCYGSRSTDNLPQVIADNIENMQILYGVTTDGGTIYKNATDMDQEWESVVSVQVAILVSSNQDVLSRSETKEHNLLGQIITTTDSKKMYKTYSTTINLPNRSQG
jgi:hypothetical protein